MPTGVVLLAELLHPVSEDEIGKLRRDFLADLNLTAEDFYLDGPLRLVSIDAGPFPPGGDQRNTWINVNLWKSYYSESYPRGDIELFIRCADWIESRLQRVYLWYGDDVNDNSLFPFPREKRQEYIARLQKKAILVPDHSSLHNS